VLASLFNGPCGRRLGATRAPVIWTTVYLHILSGALEHADLRADLDFVAVEKPFDQDTRYHRALSSARGMRGLRPRSPVDAGQAFSGVRQFVALLTIITGCINRRKGNPMRPALVFTLSFAPLGLALMADVTKAEEQASTAVELPEITVRAEAQSTTLPDIGTARHRIERTPGAVNIVDPEQYRSGRVNTLQDLLGYTPGVFIQPRFGSDEARLSIRGSGLQRTFHLRGIHLLHDGVPLNLADGSGDFQAIDGLSTDYIEVYRGANALQYGSTTLGGAINFVSPSGYTAPVLQARAEYGSYDYRRFQGAAAGALGLADGFLSYTHTEQDGFQRHSEQNNERVFGNLGLRFDENLETRFFVHVTDTESQLPGNLTKAQLEADPRQANPFNVSGNQKRDFFLSRLSNKTTYTFGANRLELIGFYAYKDLFHPIFQVLDIVYDDYGGGLRLVSEAPWFGRQNILTAGFNAHAGLAEDDRFRNVGGGHGARTQNMDQRSVNYSVYFEEQHYVAPKLALVGGGQFSHATRELEDKLLSDGDSSFDESFTAFSPKFGARYELNENVQIFGNVSRSFEPPSFGELSGGQLITVVDDQEATTVEVGTRGTYDPWSMIWDVAYYSAWVSDELLSLADARGQPLGTISADATTHQGIELGLVNRFLDRFELRQIYLWNDFDFDGDAVFGDNQLAGIPEHFYRAEFLYHFPWGFYFGPNVEWVPGDYPVDHANTLFADSYAIMGLKGGYRSKRGFGFFIEGRNLTDNNYAATTGVIDNARGRDSAQFLPGDGASVFAGIEWRM